MRHATVFTCILLLSMIVPAMPLQDKSHEQLAKAFLGAIKTKDFKNLQALTTPLKVWRKFNPTKSKKYSDAQLMRLLKKNYYSKLQQDFDNIILNARRKNIDVSKLEFVEAKLQKTDGSGRDAQPFMLVYYSYGGKRGHFVFALDRIDGRYYLFEILNSISLE